MKLPVGIMQASLEMVRLRIAQQYPSEAEVIAQVIAGLNPTANALRQRKHRAKPVTQTSVTSNASSNATNNHSEPPCASRAASESPSSLQSSEIQAEEEKNPAEEEESAREARNAFVTPKVTPRVTPKSRPWKRVPATWQPTDEHRVLAREHGKDFERELEKFRDHTFASAKTDADATFRNWLRNERGGYGGGGKPAPVKGAMAPVSKSFGNGRVDLEQLLREREEAGHGRA